VRQQTLALGQRKQTQQFYSSAFLLLTLLSIIYLKISFHNVSSYVQVSFQFLKQLFQLCFSYNKGAAHAANQQQCRMEFHSSLTLSCYFLLLQRTVLQMEFRSNLAILTAIIFISFQVVASVLKILWWKIYFQLLFSVSLIWVLIGMSAEKWYIPTGFFFIFGFCLLRFGEFLLTGHREGQYSWLVM
jgi:hypothetical protein